MIRLLWEGGQKSHYGEHYTVENAQIWTLPEESPPILVSGFGPKAIRLGGRVGDGYCGVAPDAELVSLLSSGDGDKPAHAGMKVCWDEDEVRAREIANRLWPTDALPGELGQELPTTAHYEQAVSLVTETRLLALSSAGRIQSSIWRPFVNT